MPTEINLTAEQRERFWSLVTFPEIPDDGCWIWTGRCYRDGYGCFNCGRHSQITAHRVAYRLCYGEQPGKLHVCHHCDNRACVRPDHLFLGTHQDNMDDMMTKGRRYRILDWTVVNEMRRLCLAGWTQKQIREKFGHSVTSVLANRIWHDPDYAPPHLPVGPRSVPVVIDGDEKTLKEWSLDPRCEIGLVLLRRRYRSGVRGHALLARRSTTRGRPAMHKKTPFAEQDPRVPLVLEWDALGMGLVEINEELTARGMPGVSRKQIDSLTRDFQVPPELQAKLDEMPSYKSEWACRSRAIELGLPASVVLRQKWWESLRRCTQ